MKNVSDSIQTRMEKLENQENVLVIVGEVEKPVGKSGFPQKGSLETRQRGVKDSTYPIQIQRWWWIRNHLCLFFDFDVLAHRRVHKIDVVHLR